MHLALCDITATLGGAQRLLVDVARGMLARGWQVSAALGDDGPLAEQLAQARVPVTLLRVPAWAGQNRRPSALHPGLWCVGELTHWARQRGISAWLVQQVPAALLGGAAARMSAGRLCWLPSTASDVQRFPLLARLAGRLATGVLLPGWLEGSLPPARTVIPAIDLKALRRQAPPRRGRGEAPVVGMVGPWQPAAGHQLLLQAFHLLHVGGRPGRLRLAGDGQPTDERHLALLHGMVRALGLQAHVILEEADDIPAFLAACDIIAVPALQETCGRLLLEAAALGRPAVASRVAGAEAVIDDGRSGLLASPHSPRALADALELLLGSPALCSEMGRLAREHAETHFTLDPLLDAIEAVLLPSRAAVKQGVLW